MTQEILALLAALGVEADKCASCGCRERHHKENTCWVCMECPRWQSRPWLQHYLLAKKVYA